MSCKVSHRVIEMFEHGAEIGTLKIVEHVAKWSVEINSETIFLNIESRQCWARTAVICATAHASIASSIFVELLLAVTPFS